MNKRLKLILLKKSLMLPVYYLKLVSFAHKYPDSVEKSFAFMKDQAGRVSKSGKIQINAIGVENIPKESGFVFYPNHQGLFDVLLFLVSCPQPFSFVIKKESANIPLLKQVIQATGSLVMDREDIRQSMQVILSATAAVKEGRNFLIFAEGTRSKRGNITGEFKGGSFRIATKSKAPIVPCALIDSFIPLDSTSTEPIEVKLIYLPPMFYDEYCTMSTNDIADEVKRRIDEAIQLHSKESKSE